MIATGHRLLGLAFVFFFSLPALAYIPPFWMVMSRVAENHGHGLYTIEQDVIFQHKGEPLVVHEQWLVEGEDSLRLVAYGKKDLKDKFKMTAVYNGNTRHYVDSNGIKKAVKMDADWFEPFFYFRFSKKIKPVMFSHKMIPKEGLQMPVTPRTAQEALPRAESFVRLARVGGRVAWAVGTPTPVGASEHNPGLWIEQDAFNILKLRLPSQVEVRADKYNSHPRNFWLPQQRDVIWNQNQVRINVLKVTPIANATNAKSQLSPSSLDFGKSPGVATQLPDDPVIQEFYSRFR